MDVNIVLGYGVVFAALLLFIAFFMRVYLVLEPENFPLKNAKYFSAGLAFLIFFWGGRGLYRRSLLYNATLIDVSVAITMTVLFWFIGAWMYKAISKIPLPPKSQKTYFGFSSRK